MTMHVPSLNIPSRRKMTWRVIRGRTWRAKLILLPVVALVGLLTWMVLPLPSDAQSQAVDARSSMPTPDTSWFNPVITPTEATLAPPPDETAALETSPIDGLKISSQSWRRGGLGSKALVTFTLRNDNDFAVRDIDIFCSFARRDGSHLTDRTRTIHDVVKMKSWRTFARLHVGFVNVNANQAKCSLLSASRI